MAVHPHPQQCYRPAMGRKTVLTALLALALTACGGGSSTPPTAGQIARKIPGCHKPFAPTGGVSVQASTEQECSTPSAEVFVATFTSASLQRQWIIAQQPSGCGAVRGSDWAVYVLATGADGGCQVEDGVAKALHGQLASG